MENLHYEENSDTWSWWVWKHVGLEVIWLSYSSFYWSSGLIYVSGLHHWKPHREFLILILLILLISLLLLLMPTWLTACLILSSSLTTTQRLLTSSDHSLMTLLSCEVMNSAGSFLNTRFTARHLWWVVNSLSSQCADTLTYDRSLQHTRENVLQVCEHNILQTTGAVLNRIFIQY